jgi:hypothetical protein
MITQSERSQLRSIVRSRSLPHSLVRRAQIVLLSAAGAANREVARRCGVSAPVVSLWRQRYQQRGITENLCTSARHAKKIGNDDTTKAAPMNSKAAAKVDEGGACPGCSPLKYVIASVAADRMSGISE